LIAVIALFLAFAERWQRAPKRGAELSIEASNCGNSSSKTSAAPRRWSPPTKQAQPDRQHQRRSRRLRSESRSTTGAKPRPATAPNRKPRRQRRSTVELSRRAIEEQHLRDTALARYHHYEIASAAFQDRHRAGVGDGDHRMVALSFLAAGLASSHCVHGDRAVAPHAVHLL